MDLKKYPEMVSGVDGCVTYADTNQNGLQIVKSTYDISALHMKVGRHFQTVACRLTRRAWLPRAQFKYYVTHTYDPAQRCMVFHLDYDRRSDLDDTVGYWYVDPAGRATCRVFYSCECKLRGWVPGPVYNMLTKEAVKKATTWVERESVKEWRSSKSPFGKFNPAALKQAVDHVREQLKEAADKLPAPPPLPPLRMPQLPSLPNTYEPQRQKASDWLGERRRAASGAATRLAAAVRLPPKRATA